MLPFTDDSGIFTVEPRVEQIQKRPFAQLMGQNLSNSQCLILEFISDSIFAALISTIGSSNPVGENNVVQWEHKASETFTNHMGYSKGQLLVQMEGHYYLYSKVTLNAAEECSLVQHRVMKVTQAYDQAIELMKSKRLASAPHLPDTFLAFSVVSWRLCHVSSSSHCTWNPKVSTPKSSPGEDLRNSFLAGIFHLQRGDKIYVTLEDIQKIHRGMTDNIMGAFMIAP